MKLTVTFDKRRKRAVPDIRPVYAAFREIGCPDEAVVADLVLTLLKDYGEWEPDMQQRWSERVAVETVKRVVRPFEGQLLTDNPTQADIRAVYKSCPEDSPIRNVLALTGVMLTATNTPTRRERMFAAHCSAVIAAEIATSQNAVEPLQTLCNVWLLEIWRAHGYTV